MSGLLKLFSEKCVSVLIYISTYVCLSIRTDPREKILSGKYSLYAQNKGKTNPL